MIGILLDENLPRAIAHAIHARDPESAVRRIGDGIAPNIGTADPAILDWLEAHDFVLVTNNRESMPVHISDHLRAGRHIPGVLQIPKSYSIGSLADEILLHIGASLPGELEDHITHVHLDE